MQTNDKQGQKHLILVLPIKSICFDSIFTYFFIPWLPSGALLILAALTPKDYRVTFLNQRIFLSSQDYAAGSLVGISCNTFNVSEGYKMADRFRKAGSTVIMGGVHVSHLPQEALEHCDSVVIGEAESVWHQVVRDYESGQLKRTYQGVALDDWFTPSYEYFLSFMASFKQIPMILSGRGCKYRCEFCVPFFGKPRSMKLDQVLGLVSKAMEGVSGKNRKICFHDDNIFADPVYAKKLFKALIPLKLKWSCSSSIDIALDDEALSLAQESGCSLMFIGFETILPESFPKTSVGEIKSSADYLPLIRKIQSRGILIRGGFILGLDNCTHRYCLLLLKFLLISGLDKASCELLVPFPGSRLFERLKQEGRLLTFDWRKYDVSRLLFKPKHMSTWDLMAWRIVFMFIVLMVSRSRIMQIFKGVGVVIFLFLSLLMVCSFVYIMLCLFGIILLKCCLWMWHSFFL
ncbi:MAG: radical SAM protein [Candidatus Omnitrophota bacterium]